MCIEHIGLCIINRKYKEMGLSPSHLTKRCPHKDLVKIFVNWSFKLTNLVLMSLDTICSQMKWQSISMCLVLSWKTGLELIWSASWLSHISVIWMTSPNCNSWNNFLSQTSSQVAEDIALYSASVLDLATTLCFLPFQEIKLPLIETQYPEVDLLSERDSTQSTFE